MSWKSGLFGCFGDFSLCLISYCAFPLAIGKNAESVGENSAVLWVIAVQFAPCIAGALLRGMIRKKAGIEGSFFTDCLLWAFCSCCALCQETAQTGSIDYLMQPELQQIQRDATSGS